MRLIDADNLVSICEIMADKTDSPQIWEQTISMIKSVPTIEAEPVKHGHWVDDFCSFVCSVCGERISDSTLDDYFEPRYCPNCGAQMDFNEGEEA